MENHSEGGSLGANGPAVGLQGCAVKGAPPELEVCAAPRVEEVRPSPDPLDAFERLCRLPMVIFLDSPEGAGGSSRYAYLAASPFLFAWASGGSVRMLAPLSDALASVQGINPFHYYGLQTQPGTIRSQRWRDTSRHIGRRLSPTRPPSRGERQESSDTDSAAISRGCLRPRGTNSARPTWRSDSTTGSWLSIGPGGPATSSPKVFPSGL